jgi:hypothetical protein
MEMADEFGSIGEIQSGFWSGHGDFRLYPNHSNTCVVFGQHTESGVGIFFANAADPKKKLVGEQPEKGWSSETFGMLGWSPDDRFFACAMPTPHSHQSPGEILICDGASGEIAKKVPANVNPSQLMWLTTHSFAYAFVDVGASYLEVVEQKPDKDWAQISKPLKLGKNISGLVGTTSRSVAWRIGNELWALEVGAGTAQKIWETTNAVFKNFSYSHDSEVFSLNCANGTNSSVIYFRAPTNLRPEGTFMDKPPALTELPYSAVLSNESGLNTFYLSAGSNPPMVALPWNGQVLNYQVNGDCLFITGDLTNHFPGIWKYNLKTRVTDEFVSAPDRRPKYAQPCTPLSGVFTNSAGRRASYLIWQPLHVVAGKKYPVIIGQTPYFGWLPYTQIANAGCYFVFVERPSWFEGLNNWGQDVMTAYDQMAKNPNVDLHQVFLFGASAETSPLCRLLEERTDLWRGAILFNPTVMPEPSRVGIYKLLLLDGTEEGAKVIDNLRKHQDDASRAGISVDLALVNGAPHIFRSNASEREKTRALTRFIFGD